MLEPALVPIPVPAWQRPARFPREGIGWLAFAAITLAVGIIKGINLVIVLAYMLIGLWGINQIMAGRALTGLSARRGRLPTLWAGLPAAWTIDLHDGGKARGICTIVERMGEHAAAWLLVRRRVPETLRLTVTVVPLRRGRQRIEPLDARSAYPFGLARCSVPLLPGEEVIVLPRPARVDVERLQAWLDRAAVERDGEHRRVRRLVERAAEIRGLRDYRSGDPPRRIDWKATARRNRLTVREYEDTVPPRLTLIVEPWLPAAAAPADHERLERVLSLAAGICRAWRRAAGAHLTLVLTGPEPVGLDGPPGAAFTQSLLIALALEPGGPTADPTEVIQSLPSGSRLAPILFLSARPASPLAALVERLLGRPAACLGPDAAADWFQLETDPVRQRPVAT